MEEPNAMTVESLRARLLSERSISKSERERADLLAQRVSELEEQLNVVSLQRRKAEKAAAHVLAVLADLQISHLLDGLDSTSELDESTKADSSCNGSMLSNETLPNLRSAENESEALSGSGFEYSPSTGRKLPWRNTKDSSHSPEKKTFMDMARQRAINSSSGYSARRTGKSHRRIRRRDTRSIDEFLTEGCEKTTCSRDASKCSAGESSANREGSEHDDGGKQGSPLVSDEPSKDDDGNYFGLCVRDDNVEGSPHSPEQLTGHLDEELNARRQWEENITGYSSGIQDSFDPANHSDITEEQCEMKTPEISLSFAPEALAADHHRTNELSADAGFSEVPQVSESSSSTTNPHKSTLQDQQQRASLLSRDFSVHEFSFPVSREQTGQTPHGHPTPWHLESCSEISSGVAATLQQLKQAKVLLNQESSNLVSLGNNIIKQSGSGRGKEEKFELPFVTSSLFRIPVDYESGVAAVTDAQFRGSPRLDSVHEPSEIPESKSHLSSTVFESRRDFSFADALRTAYSGATPSEQQWRIPLDQARQSDEPATTQGVGHFGAHYFGHALPPEKSGYPFLLDPALMLGTKGASSRLKNMYR